MITTNFEHHVVGAVHEIVLRSGERDTLRQAIEHERNDCHAARIVIDLTAVEDPDPTGLLGELADFEEDHDRWVVKLEQEGNPIPLGEFAS